jgi:hypothetical protein
MYCISDLKLGRKGSDEYNVCVAEVSKFLDGWKLLSMCTRQSKK